jgi:hypothetical protein
MITAAVSDPAPVAGGILDTLLPALPASIVWVLALAFTGHTIWCFRQERTRQRAIDHFASPVAGATFALLALVAGTVSQFYPEKITAAVPLTYADRSPISAALAFWITVFLMAVLGVAHYAAAGRQRVHEVATLQDESRELRRHTTKLVETLRTLPPESFLRDYPALCADMLAGYTRGVRSLDPDELRGAIRGALRSTALMAHAFSRRGSASQYRATVMRYRDATAVGGVASWSPDQRVLYPSGFEPSVLRGALDFVPTLSTRATSERAEELEGALPVRIAIPEPPRDQRVGTAPDGRLRVVPGAAVAYLLGRPFMVADTRSIRPAEGEYDLPEAVMAALDGYFREGAGAAVRSFVSLPLHAEPGGMAGERLGVLTIELEDTHVFDGDDGRVEQFALAIAPVYFVIGWLLTLLAEAEPQGSCAAP